LQIVGVRFTVEALEVGAENWEQEITKSTTLTAVYFWHEQCPWCLRFAPVIDEVSKEYKSKIKFARLNVLANPLNQEIANNFGVMSTPTLLFLCKGRPVGQVVGLQSKEDFERGLNDISSRYTSCLAQSTALRPAYVV
jgi:thioredoxin 1